LELAVSIDTGIEQDSEPSTDDTPERDDPPEPADGATGRAGQRSWGRIVAYGVLPALSLILALGAGYFKWQGDSARETSMTRIESVRAVTDCAVAMLSYRPDTADKDLIAASERMTGTFRDDYTKLVTNVVIPGTKQKKISTVATVPAAASVSATENHAVVLLFIDQSIVVGNDPPTSTASSARMTLDRVHDQWLVSQFEPV